jgi:hypothetical protein
VNPTHRMSQQLQLIAAISGVLLAASGEATSDDLAIGRGSAALLLPDAGSLTADAVDIATCPGVHGCKGTVGTTACPDDWAAVQACLNANLSRHMWFSKQIGPSNAAIAPPDYYFAQPLVPCGNHQWLDGVTGNQSGGAVLKFAAGATGISIVTNTTVANGVSCYQNTLPSVGAQITALSLQGSERYVAGSSNTLTSADGIRSHWRSTSNAPNQCASYHHAHIAHGPTDRQTLRSRPHHH